MNPVSPSRQLLDPALFNVSAAEPFTTAAMLLVLVLCGVQGVSTRKGRSTLVLWCAAVGMWFLAASTGFATQVAPRSEMALVLAPILGAMAAWSAIRRLLPADLGIRFLNKSWPLACIAVVGAGAPHMLAATASNASLSGSCLAAGFCVALTAPRLACRKLRVRMLAMAGWIAVGGVAIGCPEVMGRALAALSGPSPGQSARSAIEAFASHAWIAGLTGLFLGLHYDHEHRMLLRLARKDELTGLNRRAGMLEHFSAQCLRRDDRIAVIMVDLDHFKQINDRYGHAIGDSVLSHFGQLIRTVVRDADLAARYGGEEFCVILGRADADGARLVAERLLDAARQSRVHSIGGEQLSFTASAGFAISRADDLDNCLRSADEALYAAKRLGRDRVIGPGAPNTGASEGYATAVMGEVRCGS